MDRLLWLLGVVFVVLFVAVGGGCPARVVTLVNGNAASGYESEGVGPERVADLAALSPGQLDAYCSQVLLLHCGCRRCRFRLWVEYGIIDLRVA